MSEAMIRNEAGPDDTVVEDRVEGQPIDRARLLRLAESILTKRDEAMKHRTASGIERQWREDEKLFDNLTESDSQSMMDYATGEATSRRKNTTTATRSQVIVNILRSKCETAEGRFCEIQLPVDDKNYGFEPTPVPTLVKGLKDDRPVVNTVTQLPMRGTKGEEIKASDVAKAKMDKAKDAMEGMEAEVDDQLTECDFNGESRKMIQDAVRFGTGILKGPNVIKQVRKAYVPRRSDAGGAPEWVMEMIEDPTPATRHVDYWNVYPDPGCKGDISRASYVWEYDELLPRDLRSLVGLPGYFTEVIEEILKEEPFRTTVDYNAGKSSYETKRNTLSEGQAYEKWEYHGDVDRADLEALGVNCEDLKGNSLTACVVLVGDKPIKVELGLLDTGDLPYDFFQWCKVKNSPWGIGIVRVGTWAQRVIQGAWRATMDNARDSSGFQIIVSDGVEPADGNWEFNGRKFWRANGSIDDVSKAFAQFQLTSVQKELEAIINMALRFLDMETALPMLFQGEEQDPPDTLGATNVIIDSANVALRTRVKFYDDQITKPHISRYYYWNMQYNKNPDIKGDYNVKPRGVEVLLVRDQQAQTIKQLFSLKGDPDVNKEVHWGKAVRALFSGLQLDVLKTDEEKKEDEVKEKERGTPVDPQVAAAQIRAQVELEKAKANGAFEKEKMAFNAQQAELDRQHELVIKSIERDNKMMELSQASGIALDKIKAELTMDAKRLNMMLTLADKKVKTPELVTPPLEPVGRAPEGEAYQK